MDFTTSEKELLRTMIRTEFDKVLPTDRYDNSRLLQLIELAEKLYLGRDFINQLKTDLED